MSVKSILCIFSGHRHELNALGSAFNLANNFKANLRVINIAEPPMLYEAVVGAGYVYGNGTVADILEKEAGELNQSAEIFTQEYSEKYDVPLSGEGPITVDNAQASFRTIIGTLPECLPKAGRTVDLIVMGFDNAGESDVGSVVTALFKTGSPVMTLPRLPGAVLSPEGFASTVVLAWDGSLSGSRALRSALPYLKHAHEVYLVSVEGMDDPQDKIGDHDVVNYLKSHGVIAEFIHCERVGHSIGHIVLEKARDLNADLLVLGAYGHGHLGEMILGGVSNHIIKHAHMPLLLAH